jgi:hypothetical protein
MYFVTIVFQIAGKGTQKNRERKDSIVMQLRVRRHAIGHDEPAGEQAQKQHLLTNEDALYGRAGHPCFPGFEQ